MCALEGWPEADARALAHLTRALDTFPTELGTLDREFYTWVPAAPMTLGFTYTFRAGWRTAAPFEARTGPIRETSSGYFGMSFGLRTRSGPGARVGFDYLFESLGYGGLASTRDFESRAFEPQLVLDTEVLGWGPWALRFGVGGRYMYRTVTLGEEVEIYNPDALAVAYHGAGGFLEAGFEYLFYLLALRASLQFGVHQWFDREVWVEGGLTPSLAEDIARLDDGDLGRVAWDFTLVLAVEGFFTRGAGPSHVENPKPGPRSLRGR